MKLLKTTLLVLLVPLFSWAGLTLGEPAALLQKAKSNRTALRDVILEMELNIPEMRDPATFDKYFYLLDQLQDLSTSSGLETYYPNIVKNLGLNMVGNGIRWLDVTKDSSDKMAYYVKWMDAETLGRLLGLIEYQMETVKDVTRLTSMATNLESILPSIDQIAASLPYVQLGYRRLISDAAVYLLETETLTPEQYGFWLKKILITTSVSEYLEYLNKGIYALNATNKADAHKYLSRLTILMAHTQQMPATPPNWLITSIGDSLTEVILRMVKFEEFFAPNEFGNAVNTLPARHVQSLIQQWMAQPRLPSTAYVAHYMDISRTLVERASVLGLVKDSADLKKWLAQMAAPVLAQQLELEGQYKVTDENGKVMFFTIALAKENSLIAAFGDASGQLYKVFYNVSYNSQTNSFVAAQRDPDVDHDQNPAVKFEVDGKGGISILDPFIRTGSQKFKGKKVQSFVDLWKTAPNPAPVADGTYEGTMLLPNGNKMKAKLIITTFNGYVMGRLDSEGLALDLNIGSQGTDGVVILTTGRTLTGSWFQIRANVFSDRLSAYVIIGAKGQGAQFTLKKVK